LNKTFNLHFTLGSCTLKIKIAYLSQFESNSIG
jgi:hypothetical protein